MVILKSINCDSKVETREYDSLHDFVKDVDTIDEEKAFKSPMLDDKILSIVAHGQRMCDFYNVYELYHWALFNGYRT